MVAVIQSSWSRLTRQPSLARPAATPTSQVPTIVFSSSFNTPVQAFTVCSPAWLVNYFLFASYTARCSPNVASLHHFPPTSPPALIQPGCHRIADHTTPTCTLVSIFGRSELTSSSHGRHCSSPLDSYNRAFLSSLPVGKCMRLQIYHPSHFLSGLGPNASFVSACTPARPVRSKTLYREERQRTFRPLSYRNADVRLFETIS
jgi:hypothetical protein